MGDFAGSHIGTDLTLTQGFAQCLKDNVCWATGVEELYENPSIDFYPNPTTGLLIFEGAYQDIHRYELYNSTAQKLEAKKIDQNQISLEHLSPGIYYLRVFGRNEKLSLITKVMKQ